MRTDDREVRKKEHDSTDLKVRHLIFLNLSTDKENMALAGLLWLSWCHLSFQGEDWVQVATATTDGNIIW